MTMYSMSRFEYMQYEIASKRLQELKIKHAAELQRAYDGIHPTRTAIDYDLGRLYAESIDPCEYATYLVDLQAEHERKEEYWYKRASVFEQALSKLSEQELNDLYDNSPGSYQVRLKANNKAKQIVSNIVAGRPDLQRNPTISAEVEDVEEYDKKIENMNNEELFKDYEDPLEGDLIKEKCIHLRYVHEMAYTAIGEQLGVTRARVRQIIAQHELKLSEKELKVWRNSRLTQSQQRNSS